MLCCCFVGFVRVASCWLVLLLRWLRCLSFSFVDSVVVIACCWLFVWFCLFVVWLCVRGCSCACSADVR